MLTDPTQKLTEAELAVAIRTAAREIGYAHCGFTDTSPFKAFQRALERRAHDYPQAAEVYNSLLKRVDPRATCDWARSIVVCIRNFGKYNLPPEPARHIGLNYLADRRIAACPDNQMPRRMTHALKQLGIKVKRGGVPDRAAAVRAGVVAIGRNGFAYSPDYGSWINIETWRVSASLPTSAPLPSPCPPNCRLCIDSCPTQAIIEPYCMRLDRCIAYLSYSAPEPISQELAGKMPPWIYGCDTCQNVCPLNQGKWLSIEPAPWIDEVASLLRPESLAEMDVTTYCERIHALFNYIPATEQGLQRWHRNARRVLL